MILSVIVEKKFYYTYKNIFIRKTFLLILNKNIFICIIKFFPNNNAKNHGKIELRLLHFFSFRKVYQIS